MASLYTLLLFLTCFSSVLGSTTINNITTSHFLQYPQTISSNNALFQLGFFNPTNSTNYYAGIWYTNKDSDSDVHQVIWVANRDNPLNDSPGLLRISEDGNLQLLNKQNKTFWTSNVSRKNDENSIAQIQDKGNLVLISSVTGCIIWDSFDHPTDSMLPLMKLSVDQSLKKKGNLVSWRSDSDPSLGRFTLGINPSNPFELFIWDDDDRPYWRTGPWVGNSFIGMALRPSVLLDRFSYVNDSQGKLGFTLLIPAEVSNLEHYVLNYNGTVVRKDWDDETRKWVTVWKSYSSECDVYGKCGEFGICNPKKTRICDCLKGFVPKNEEEWNKGNWSSGCVRRMPLKCGGAEGRADGFLKLRNMKVPVGAELLPSNGEDDCERQCLGKCSCLAYTYIYSGFVCMIWNRSLIDIQDFSSFGVDLFIRLAHSELGKTSKWKMILGVVLITMGITTFAIMYCLWRWRGLNNARNTVADVPSNNDMSEPCASLNEFKDLPLFKFERLLVATKNFQESNKLGQGGFGPVYKGKLEDGQEIAVKRLSRSSDQGVQEFMNEVLLVSKLQHRNLVRLLGCCVEGEEKMLVYEYMSNKSLDALLFDSVHREVLDWKKRFNIIDGICRGLLYLHRDSRLKVIHRDLKASNILLDEDLNPKISDFGMARIFGHKEDQACTIRVVGTFGYMSPEYAMEGRFSEKSDVYSFGVLLLEIISGRTNKSFDKDESLSLLGYAWKLWNEDDILSLVDPTISNPCFQTEIWRCIQIGLLCVQALSEDRPTISDVISMLRCEIAELPYPMQPGFLLKRFSTRHEVAPNSQFSVNLVSLTCINGR